MGIEVLPKLGPNDKQDVGNPLLGHYLQTLLEHFDRDDS
jgi:hypothetical protein